MEGTLDEAASSAVLLSFCICTLIQNLLLEKGFRYIHQLQHRHHWEGKGALITGEASPAVLVAKKPPANAGDVKARV